MRLRHDARHHTVASDHRSRTVRRHVRRPSFWTWRVIAKLIDGIPLTEQREIDLFEQCTGRSYSRFNRRAVKRFIILAGRRAGKDRFEVCGRRLACSALL